MRLEPILRPDLALIIDDVSDIDELMRRLAEVGAEAYDDVSADQIADALRDREGQTPTVTDEGVAFPHAMLPDVNQTLLIVAKVDPAVSFGDGSSPAPDIIFCMIGSTKKPWEHVRLLARLARISRGEGALEKLRDAKTPDELFERLVEEDRVHG